jgi:hypothetical protein
MGLNSAGTFSPTGANWILPPVPLPRWATRRASAAVSSRPARACASSTESAMRAVRTESASAWLSSFIAISAGLATNPSATKNSSELTRYSRNGGMYRATRPCT